MAVRVRRAQACDPRTVGDQRRISDARWVHRLLEGHAHPTNRVIDRREPMRDAPPRTLPPLDPAILERRVFPALKAAIRSGYFTLEVTGQDLPPRAGPVVYVSNHSGWFMLDTLVIGLAIWQALGPTRFPYMFGHDVLLRLPV